MLQRTSKSRRVDLPSEHDGEAVHRLVVLGGHPGLLP
jgi:hypothetical protein